MGIVVRIAQFLLSLTILVLVHELGHFLMARLFKTRVEKFRIFFDYKFTIWKKKIGETDFGFGWIPLGGYVKIAGMIDESMDTEQMKRDPQPWEFRSKPAWQRLIIMIGGVVFNLIFAWLLYSASLQIWGESFLSNDKIENGLVCSEVAEQIGFKTGDRIISIYGEKVERFSEINARIIMDAPGEVTVLRDGETKAIYVRDDEVGAIINSGGFLFLSPRIPFIVGGVAEGSGAMAGGIETGDQILGFNDLKLDFFDQYAVETKKYAGQLVNVDLLRNNEKIQKTVLIDSLGKMGVYATSPYDLMEIETKNYGFWASIPKGFDKAKQTTVDYVKQLKMIFSPEIKTSESLGGFISIGRIFPGLWDWESFWALTAFLSILLGVMNILPIPALDGGHVVILLFEMITGRKPNQRFLEVVQMIGITLILFLVIYANANDVIRYIIK